MIVQRMPSEPTISSRTWSLTWRLQLHDHRVTWRIRWLHCECIVWQCPLSTPFVIAAALLLCNTVLNHEMAASVNCGHTVIVGSCKRDEFGGPPVISSGNIQLRCPTPSTLGSLPDTSTGLLVRGSTPFSSTYSAILSFLSLGRISSAIEMTPLNLSVAGPDAHARSCVRLPVLAMKPALGNDPVD